MPDLPSVNCELAAFTQEISGLRRGKEGEHLRPHKLVMLLSVIELADRGLLGTNRIYLSDPLLHIFENIFVLVRRKDDLCQPGPPFFHLRSSGFWFHRVRPDREGEYTTLTTTGGGLQMIDEYVEYAYLRDDVYALIANPETRQKLRLFISNMLNSAED